MRGTVEIVIESAAVLVLAVSGMITASRKRIELVGTCSLALVTAFGGGTLRDLLLDRRPFFWVERPEYPLVIFALCLVFVYSRKVYDWAQSVNRHADVVDALGLALFSISGTGISLQAGQSPFIASLLGVITGTSGGVLRDLLVSEIPLLFRTRGLYAIAAFAGCWVYLAALAAGASPVVAGLAGFVTIAGLRVASVRFGLRFPEPHWWKEGDSGEPPFTAPPR